MTRLLEVADLAVRYRRGRRHVTGLAGIDLFAESGELVVVAGPSGAGKSTLLHVVAGGLRPTSRDVVLDGDVTVAGCRVLDLADNDVVVWRRRTLGLLWSRPSLVPALLGRDNVAVPLLLAGYDRSGAAGRAAALLDAVGAADAADLLPAEMSGDALMRTGLARALAADPMLVLCDEPTAHLDADATRRLFALLRAVASGDAPFGGRTRAVVLVSHDPTAFEYADRTIRLVDGRIAA